MSKSTYEVTLVADSKRPDGYKINYEKNPGELEAFEAHSVYHLEGVGDGDDIIFKDENRTSDSLVISNLGYSLTKNNSITFSVKLTNEQKTHIKTNPVTIKFRFWVDGETDPTGEIIVDH